MFLRYHQLLGMNRTDKVTAQNLPLYASSGIWDVTMASLAISVKFHRDFLFPLAPIESGDYLDISPHDMDYDDFEYAQRSMLGFFSYELGITPQPILDQLWIALPSLRELLEFDGRLESSKEGNVETPVQFTIWRGSTGYEVAEKFKITATEDAEGVILDIQAVVGVSEIEADVCRRWLDLNAAVPGL
ncbi:hypothetical protein D9756_009250 [Leucocoprinus leucothites]|uniref:Uncharacterized protein n=1 Tax=Leucocoprinus leucothites TaxID=201217 RepID=A0A8H5CY34_9AGAR|nr:hypothetical protein D9756_009250 [Leucoagaricus leucothites]